MGGSTYSDTVYSDWIADARRRGVDLFSHDADVRAGRRPNRVHEKLDPGRSNRAGKIIRESFDSAAHPSSRAVAVLFDVTGSMAGVPRQFVNKLDRLMAFLIKKGYLEHPQIMFGAIGDATCDHVPLQIGQFEAGNEMDEALSLIVLEGGGGGSTQESYELGMYFLARHTDLDCLSKRGEKGYCFILGDESPYGAVKRGEVKRLIGDSLQEDIPLAKILSELREKFEVFWVLPAETNHAADGVIIDRMRTLFGQNYLRLEKPDDVCELIASTIGVAEGFDIHEVSVGLKDLGADGASVDRASTALAAYAAAHGALVRASVSGDLPTASGKDDVVRL